LQFKGHPQSKQQKKFWGEQQKVHCSGIVAGIQTQDPQAPAKKDKIMKFHVNFFCGPSVRFAFIYPHCKGPK
jgi:hypothetical protein